MKNSLPYNIHAIGAVPKHKDITINSHARNLSASKKNYDKQDRTR